MVPRKSDSDSDSDISLDLNSKDSDDEYNSETEMITERLEAKNATAKKKTVTISQPKPGVIPVMRDLFGENEILEDLYNDPDTYQGGKKEAKDIENQKQNDKKRAQMKQDQRILNNSADILSHLNSDAESTPQVHQTTRPARRGRVSASGRRLVENPPPDVATTPKKPRGKILL